jgi:competence protein ComEC
MWLGMLAAFAGQISTAIPIEPLNQLNAGLIAYIEQLAAWFAEPGWAQLTLSEPGWVGVTVAYGVMLAFGAVLIRAARRRAGVLPGLARTRRRRRWRLLAAGLAAGVLALAAVALAGPGPPGAQPQPAQLRVTMLDVGQGDAILLDPPRSEPVLVDGGPPGAGLPELLDDHEADALAAVLLTHDQLDHYGGLLEVVGERPIGAVLEAGPAPKLEADAAAAGTPLRQLVRGDRLVFGGLRLEVLWPPAERSAQTRAADVNLRSIVLLARWRRFSMLLTGDAEAESSGYDPDPVDVVKLAHHGSADAGLPDLLAESDPELALISVGEDNAYGHPAPGTLEALAAHSVPVLRTDVHGQVELTIDRAGRVVVQAGG